VTVAVSADGGCRAGWGLLVQVCVGERCRARGRSWPMPHKVSSGEKSVCCTDGDGPPEPRGVKTSGFERRLDGPRVKPGALTASKARPKSNFGRAKLSWRLPLGVARSAREGHLVDALALRGDEGRGTLRKARGRCERSLIPGSPNGATHPRGYPDLNS
jgi:hypothetical protein